MQSDRNPIGWFEIYVQDMQRAIKFYEAILDTKLELLHSPDGNEMWNFIGSPDKSGACGALVKMAGVEPGGGGTLVYFSSVDCAVEEARVEASGGQVIKSKFSIGEYGFISLITDTESNMIGLHSMK